MALSDIISGAQCIRDTASFIQQRADIVYRASYSLEEFKSTLVDFDGQYKAWERRLRTYGLEADLPSITALENAKVVFEKEKKRLEWLDSCWFFGCLLMLCGVAFPTELTQGLQDLNEKIQSDLEKDGHADAAAEERVKAIASHEEIRFREDQRYVRLPTIESEIKDALEKKNVSNQTRPRVVLLEGQSGIGKSSMARYIALLYRAEISNNFVFQHSVETNSRPESSRSRAQDSHSVFDKVLFLECGEKTDPLAKHLELIKLLGWTTSLEQRDDFTQVGDQYSKSKKTHDWPEFVKGVLSRCLRSLPRVLLILDDVWDGYFLEDIAAQMQGDGSRMLATSQRSRLGEFFNRPGSQLLSISMDRITMEDAQLILQVHAGFTSEDAVPGEVKECMTELIEKISTNPHALASVATAIDKPRRGKGSEWQNVIREHEKLRSEHLSKTLKFQGVDYSSSIGVKFARLSQAETDIMIVVAMLDGPSVTEEVVQLCHSEICSERGVEFERSSVAFSSARRQLQDLRCVKITEDENRFYWSVHFLDKEFLLKSKATDVESMLRKFQQLPKKKQGLEEDPQEHLVKILGALYLRSEWANRITVALPLMTREEESIVRLRTVMCEIVSLMVRNVWTDWSLQQRSSADQVFLSLMCHRVLHEEAMTVLLDSAVSKDSLVIAVIKMAEVVDISIPEDIVMHLLRVKGQVGNVEQNQNTLILNREQCSLLYSLAHHGDETWHLIRRSLCRRQIVSSLLETFKSKSNNLYLRWLAMRTIAYLGYGPSPLDSSGQGEDRVAFLVEFPKLLSELACVLEDDTCPTLQGEAASVLYSFARFAKEDGGTRVTIFETTGQQLVWSLSQNNNIKLQTFAVCAISFLAEGGQQICRRIAGYPNAMDHVVAIINSQNSNEEIVAARIRRRALYALCEILNNIFPPGPSDEDLDMNFIGRAKECLVQVLSDGGCGGGCISENTKVRVVSTLTLIDSAKAIG